MRNALMVFKKAIPRRTFLRGAGATVALPLLDAMTPALARAADKPAAASDAERQQEALDIAMETIEALVAERGRRIAASGVEHDRDPRDRDAHVLRTLVVDDTVIKGGNAAGSGGGVHLPRHGA